MEGHRLPITVRLAGTLVVLAGLVLIAVQLVGAVLDRGSQAPVTRALVWPDGRRITVETEAGECDRVELTAEEHDRRVELTLTLTTPPEACIERIRMVLVSTVLRSPLRGRGLVDASTGRPVSGFDGRWLLATGYLPPGYRLTTNTPRTTAWGQDGPNGWTRTYERQNGDAKLDVMQTSPSARLLDGWKASRKVDVNGVPAEIRTMSYNGRVAKRAILWTAHGQGFAVISQIGGKPLPERELLRVARGLHR
jgi:hypothetical protein